MSKAWYALRRTIVPWRFDRLTKELLETLPKIGIDELIVKIDVEEFTHGQPNLQWVEKYCRKLKPFKKKVEDKGIVFSINPWITVGHNDRGRDGNLNIPGLKTLVDQNGTKCKCCACPLSKAWQGHIKNVWRQYAQLKPAVIWLEDDLRTFNHQPVENSCFCGLHLSMFSKRVGKKVNREELVAKITKPGKPHPWRKEYLDMQRDIILDMVAKIVKTVNDVSTETSFGLMSSEPRNHCMEGRDWGKLAEVMSAGPKMISRAPLGNYNEHSLRGLYHSSDSIKLTRHVLPEGTIEQTEVENIPFTQYSKSINFTFLQLAVSFALGCDGVTMNLFDHCGSPMSDEPQMLSMLGREKKYLNALADAAQQTGRQRGVQLLFSPKHSYSKKLNPGDGYALEAEDYCLAETFESLGVATTFSDEKVRATIGQSLRCYSDDEIIKMLSNGLFIDAIAAGVLVERGFGKYIGLGQIESPVCIDNLEPLSAEEYHNNAFGGEKGKMLTLITPHLGSRPSYSIAQISPKTKIISDMVDPDAKRKYPSMFAFENSIGGRVVVHLLDWTTACGTAFNHTYRRQQIQNVMQWLSKNALPAVVPDSVFPLLIRRDLEDSTIMTIFNLSLDEYFQTRFEIYDDRKIKDVHILSQAGRWQRSKALTVKSRKNIYSISYNKPVSYHRPLVIKIRFDKEHL